MVEAVRTFVAAVVLFSLTAGILSARAGDGDRKTVIVVGDTQRTSFWERVALRELNDDQREAVMRRIAEESPDLLVILGDLVSSGDDKEAWRYFDQCSAPVHNKGIPIVPLLGNHEYFGNTEAMLAEIFVRFPLLGGKTWTAVCSEGIAFILLNSNFNELTADQVREQDDWYNAQLRTFWQDTTVQAIVVCCHHPPFTNSTIVSPSRGVQQSFVPPFLAAPKAVLFVSGHCHSYEHFLWSGKHFLVTGGGGGPRQRVEVVPNRRQFEDLYRGPGERDIHFCKLSIEDGRLRVRMVQLDEKARMWREGDEFTVSLKE